MRGKCLWGVTGRVTMLDDKVIRRFWAKVDQSGGMFSCWLWTGATWSFGHGVVSIRRKLHGAHRVSWEIANGPIPVGENVLHRCDNPPCVNPSHLYLGSFHDNFQDMVSRGRLGHEHGRFVSKKSA